MFTGRGKRVGKRHAACLREGRRRGKKEGHRPVNLAEWLLPRHVGKDEVGKEARKREGIKGGEKKERARRERGRGILYAPRALAVYKGPPYCGYVLSC